MPLLLILLSTIIILGSLFFYFYTLTNGVILLILLIILVIIILRMRGDRLRGPRSSSSSPAPPDDAIGAGSNGAGPRTTFIWQDPVFIVVIAAAFYILFTHQTTQALRSPWEVVPSYFFLIYGTAILLIMVRLLPLRQVQGRNDKARGVTHCGDPEPWAGPRTFIPLSILTFLTLSISLIIFPLGSGFDPFIHQATEKIIAATGTITPKPLYYIGQYTLVVFLSKILGISVSLIDKLLVPLLASFLLPWSIMNWIKKTWRSTASPPPTIAEVSMEESPSAGGGSRELACGCSRALTEGSPAEHGDLPRHRSVSPEREAVERPFALSAFLLLPFLLSPFTTTTPYSLALLFLVVLIFSVQGSGFRVQILIALATLLIHPLVGIPAFVFLIVKETKKQRNKETRFLSYLFCALAIPLAFLLASKLSSQIHITFAPQNFIPWLRSIEWNGIYRENRFNAPFDLLYFYGFNIKNIFWFFVFTVFLIKIKRWRQSGAVISNWLSRLTRGVTHCGDPARVSAVWRSRTMPSERGAMEQDPEPWAEHPRLSLYFITFLILLTSYVLMSGFLSFNFLIGYEQADYAKRVLDIAQLFLIPFFLLGIHWWLQKIIWKLEIGNWKFATQVSVALALTLLITASFYLTYPQKIDSYSVSHAFNTSQADIDAVRWIDANAHGEDYIVLANQAVSAAAIHELGFKKYYATAYRGQRIGDSVFFYPIPTGSPLYEYYLSMVYEKPSAETMQKAMQLVGVKRSYFVLNRYWTDFEKIRAEAASQLTLIHSVNDSVLIFTLK